jgi:glutamate N-acetyltransferase/amino-acid N-acetyltransferase
MLASKKKIRVLAFALDDDLLKVNSDFKVADHINLTGEALKNIGFVPITDLYVNKHDQGAIKIACIKQGVVLTQQEKTSLLALGVRAYSYDLIKEVLYAAAQGIQVEASVYFAKVPQGFSLQTAACHIKESKKPDFAVIRSESPCLWAGTFTQNKARAFCVEKNIQLKENKVQVLACNSGNANACTKDQAQKADLLIRQELGKLNHCKADEVLFASTGKIGVPLDTQTIIERFSSFANASVQEFAQAILTTDTFIKISQDRQANFLGFAKGSGMIHPQMATMLAFVISDKKIKDLNEVQTQEFMQNTLRDLVATSFNAITVDGDSSTNDMCLCLINRQGAEISQQEFKESLKQVLDDLAYKIVADGEGLTKLSKLTIKSYLADQQALDLGRFILNSSLVKTAIHGNDPNWGRIIASLGQFCASTNIDLDIDKTQLEILGQSVFANGANTTFDRQALSATMKKSFVINMTLDLGGSKQISVYGNDLSHEYIKINAEYFT